MKPAFALLAAIAIMSLPVGSIGQAKKGTKSINDLKGNLRSIKQQKSHVVKQLQKTKGQVRKVKGDLAEVDNRLDQVQTALEQTTDKLQDGKREQKSLSERLIIATRELAETKEKVRQRLRWMYVHGEESHLALLVGSKSTGELATWKDLMERISSKDRQVFSDYRQLRDEVQNKKKRQDRLVTEIKGLVDTQKRQEGQLTNVRAEKVEVLTDLRQTQSELQKVIRQLEADEAAIGNQIEAYLRAQRAGGKPLTPAPKGRFSRPCSGPITSGFGSRFHPILKIRRLHAGLDFGSPSGAPIWAANSGVVIAAQKMRGYGNVVIIDHGGGFTTTYGHCSRLFVRSGQKVDRGQRIASVGSTGLATGPHLHFEIRINGKPVNPAKYL